jgi:hypothetical protein
MNVSVCAVSETCFVNARCLGNCHAKLRSAGGGSGFQASRHNSLKKGKVGEMDGGEYGGALLHDEN